MYQNDKRIQSAIDLPECKKKLGEFETFMDGADYGQGQLEDLERSLRKVQAILAKLLMRLDTKGVLSKDDLLDLLSEYHLGIKWKKGGER